MKISRLKKILMTIAKSYGDDRIGIFSGYVAFTTILALFPFVIFMVSLAGFIGGGTLAQNIISRGFALLPPEVMQTLAPVVEETLKSHQSGLLTFGILGTLWATISGVESLRDGLNIAHHITEKRSFIKRRLQALVFVIGGSVVFLMLAGLLIALPIALKWLPVVLGWISQHTGYTIDPTVIFPIQIVRIVVSFGLLTGAFLAMYRGLPDTEYKIRSLVPGALLAATLYLILATVYSFYLSHFGSYNVTYGSLGGIIATMAFFQLSVTVIFIGAELNATLHHLDGVENALTEDAKKDYKPRRRPHAISTSNAS